MTTDVSFRLLPAHQLPRGLAALIAVPFILSECRGFDSGRNDDLSVNDHMEAAIGRDVVCAALNADAQSLIDLRPRFHPAQWWHSYV